MKKYKVAILTATRAEYGLLRSVMQRIKEDDILELQTLVTGMHLSEAFGNTYQEIENDGFRINARIPILDKCETAFDMSRAMGRALCGFGKYFENGEVAPDLLIVLGDRYETMAVVLAAANKQIPIAHIHGGETTEGAIDEAIRHAITKFSYLHFASTDVYARRIVQLGEHPDRVFCVGALGVENIKNVKLMSRAELEKSIGFSLDSRYAVVTFHPATLEEGTVETELMQLMEALDSFDLKYIITKANADTGGQLINRMLDEYAATRSNVYIVASLGMRRYLSALRYCEMVIGNSSSGILEAPSFGVPTVDIGNRQRGRLAAESVIHCEPEKTAIIEAMGKAGEQKFKESISKMKNPYEKEGTSNNIVEIIKDFLINDRVDLKKNFYDLNRDVE